MSLVTFRRDGRPVATPVLFVEVPGGLLVRVSHDTGKIKRLRHDTRVEVRACDSRGNSLGPVHLGRARILGPEAVRPALQAMHVKYPIAGRLFTLARYLRRRRNVILEVTCEEAHRW